eukprot:GHVU01212048.1.p1 GENE.GHVU01212048.1~~GHVU01212048.1.p1  ORF type:complete len:489 (+),score=39.04 GHVU01212048.1:732-2198(+)
MAKESVYGTTRWLMSVMCCAHCLCGPVLCRYALFLDEPTSGLDSAMAFQTMRLLMDVAGNGRTVIMTVHQPRSQIFQAFDNLLLLNHGEVIYLGLASEALGYFSRIGYKCPENYNPADFMLDLVAAIPDEEDGDGIQEDGASKPKSDDHAVMLTEEERQQLPLRFKESPEYQKIVEAAAAEKEKGKKHLKAAVEEYKRLHKGNCGSWFRAIGILAWRSLLNSTRNYGAIIANFVIQLVVGLLFGFVYFQLDRSANTAQEVRTNSRNIISALFFFATNWAFGSMDTLEAFPKERGLFNRESANGVYGTFEYFLAKSLADFLFQQIPPIISMVLYTRIAGVMNSVEQQFMFILVGSFAVFASHSFAYIVSCGVASGQLANIVAPITLVVMMLTAGFYVSSDAIQAWIGWLGYISFIRYAFLGAVGCEFHTGGAFGNGQFRVTNEELLKQYSLEDTDPWWNVLWLGVLGIAYRCLGLFLLHCTNRRVGMES